MAIIGSDDGGGGTDSTDAAAAAAENTGSDDDERLRDRARRGVRRGVRRVRDRVSRSDGDNRADDNDGPVSDRDELDADERAKRRAEELKDERDRPNTDKPERELRQEDRARRNDKPDGDLRERPESSPDEDDVPRPDDAGDDGASEQSGAAGGDRRRRDRARDVARKAGATAVGLAASIGKNVQQSPPPGPADGGATADRGPNPDRNPPGQGGRPRADEDRRPDAATGTELPSPDEVDYSATGAEIDRVSEDVPGTDPPTSGSVSDQPTAVAPSNETIVDASAEAIRKRPRETAAAVAAGTFATPAPVDDPVGAAIAGGLLATAVGSEIARREPEVPIPEGPVLDTPELPTPTGNDLPGANSELSPTDGLRRSEPELPATGDGGATTTRLDPSESPVVDEPEVPVGGTATGDGATAPADDTVVPDDFPLAGRDLPADPRRESVPGLSAGSTATTITREQQSPTTRRRRRRNRGADREELQEILDVDGGTLGEVDPGRSRVRDNRDRFVFPGSSTTTTTASAAETPTIDRSEVTQPQVSGAGTQLDPSALAPAAGLLDESEQSLTDRTDEIAGQDVTPATGTGTATVPATDTRARQRLGTRQATAVAQEFARPPATATPTAPGFANPTTPEFANPTANPVGTGGGGGGGGSRPPDPEFRLGDRDEDERRRRLGAVASPFRNPIASAADVADADVETLSGGLDVDLGYDPLGGGLNDGDGVI